MIKFQPKMKKNENEIWSAQRWSPWEQLRSHFGINFTNCNIKCFLIIKKTYKIICTAVILLNGLWLVVALRIGSARSTMWVFRVNFFEQKKFFLNFAYDTRDKFIYWEISQCGILELWPFFCTLPFLYFIYFVVDVGVTI